MLSRLHKLAYGDRYFLAILDLIHQKWLMYTVDENDTIWVWKGCTDDKSESNY